MGRIKRTKKELELIEKQRKIVKSLGEIDIEKQALKITDKRRKKLLGFIVLIKIERISLRIVRGENFIEGVKADWVFIRILGGGGFNECKYYSERLSPNPEGKRWELCDMEEVKRTKLLLSLGD